MDPFEHDKVSSICFLKRMRPKSIWKLFPHNIRSGSGSFIDASTVLTLKGCGLCWTELEVLNPGNSDCTTGTRIMTNTDYVLSSFDIEGYDPRPEKTDQIPELITYDNKRKVLW